MKLGRTHRCPRCHGTGKTRHQRAAKGNVIHVDKRTCDRCGGTGVSVPLRYVGPPLERRGLLPEDRR